MISSYTYIDSKVANTKRLKEVTRVVYILFMNTIDFLQTSWCSTQTQGNSDRLNLPGWFRLRADADGSDVLLAHCCAPAIDEEEDAVCCCFLLLLLLSMTSVAIGCAVGLICEPRWFGAIAWAVAVVVIGCSVWSATAGDNFGVRWHL